MTADTTALSDRFAQAFSLALNLHGDQIRKGSDIPYVAHLMSVAALVLEQGGNEDEAIAALLHDGPEDQGGQETLEEIRRRFGHRVADIVEGCSDTFEKPKPAWRARKERYLDHLRQTDSQSVFLVSVADKVHNLRSILEDYRRLGDRLWGRFTGKKEGTLWYYAELLGSYQQNAPPRCAQLIMEMERIYREVAATAGDEARDAEGDLDETHPFPESLLDVRWEGGPPIDAIRAAQANTPHDRVEAAAAVEQSGTTEARRDFSEKVATDPGPGSPKS